MKTYLQREHFETLPRLTTKLSFLGGASGKEPTCQCKRFKRLRLDPWVGKIPWRRKWQPTPVFFLGNPMDRGVWQATVHGVADSDIT